MIRALDVLRIAVAATQAAPSKSANPMQQRTRTRDFSDVISNDIIEHLRTKPKLRTRLYQIRDQGGDDTENLRAAVPLVTEAAQSLYKTAASGSVKFDALFPTATLESIARNILNKVR